VRIPKKKSSQEDTAILNFHASELCFRDTYYDLVVNTDVVHCLLLVLLSRVDDSSVLELYRSLKASL
jgi:hypothetical protein